MRYFLLIAVLSITSTANAQTVVLQDSTCRYLTEYQTPPGVEYQSGVDVNGDPVVPADINNNGIRPPDVYEFDLTVDVADYAGIDIPAETEGLARIGTVTVENNQLKFNGEPLKPESERALIALCNEDNINESAAEPAAEIE